MKTLVLMAFLGVQILATTTLAAMPSKNDLGKARLPFCTLHDKYGGTVFLNMSRGDWAAGGQYSLIIHSEFYGDLVRENMTVTGNQFGHTFSTASVRLKTTILKKRYPYESNIPARGELFIGAKANSDLKKGLQIISCEYASSAE